MKTIGLIAAVEKRAVINALGKPSKRKSVYGFEIYEFETVDMKVVMIDSGAGEIAASAATQLLTARYAPDIVLNVGICGGLTSEMKPGTICIVDKVVHYDYDITSVEGYKKGVYMGYESPYFETSRELLKFASECISDIKIVNCASADKLVIDKTERLNLGLEFNCDICEMEAAGVIITSLRNNVPCLIIKAVSDGIESNVNDLIADGEKISDMAAQTAKKMIDYWKKQGLSI